MGLESVTYIDDLVATNPPASDPRGEGDNHISNIKLAIKNSIWPIPGFQPPLAVTLVADKLTPGLEGIVTVGGEAAAADDLKWIDYTSHRDGAFLLIGFANTGVITVKHEAAAAPANSMKVSLRGGADLVLDAVTEWILLRRNGTTAWEEMWRSHDLRDEILTFRTAQIHAAKDKFDLGLVMKELASAPGVPGGGYISPYPFAVGNDTGWLTRLDTGYYRPGLDAGVNTLADGAKTLVITDGQIFFMTPTADRGLRLPTTGVGKGSTYWVHNRASTLPATNIITVKASNSTAIRAVLPGQGVWFTALQDEPTTALHWACARGVIFQGEPKTSTVVENLSICTIPANLLRANGQSLRLTVFGSAADAFAGEIHLQFDGTTRAEIDSSSLNPYTDVYRLELTITRETATSYNYCSQSYGRFYNGASFLILRSSAISTVNFASDIVARVRLDAISAGTVHLYSYTIELL